MSRFEKLNNGSYLYHKDFMHWLDKTLQFDLGVITKDNTQKLGMYTSVRETISIEEMGQGVTRILSLLSTLMTDNNKIFLLEEIENDVHPKVLKYILEFIIEKSSNNQFIISTHSNIVLKYLGSPESSKIFSTHLDTPIKAGSTPTSTITEVKNEPEERSLILEELGYDLFDFDLHKGYLILEERSAESIIKGFLIPTFAPGLVNKLATIEAKGIGNVEATFIDFYRLFVFVHTSNVYKQKAWVAVDGDDNGVEVISKLKEKFKWPDDHYKLFKNHKFEYYYPDHFKEDYTNVLNIKDDKKRNNEKGELAKRVLKWAKENQDQAKTDFYRSAKEVISFLQSIEQALCSN